MSKNKFNKIGLEYGLFYHIVKIIQTIVGETDPASKKRNQHLSFKVGQHYHRSILSLKKTGLRIIARQEKGMFITCCFNDTFLVKKIKEI